MRRSVSNLERLFDQDDQELAQKQQELHNAGWNLQVAEGTQREAQTAFDMHRKAWRDAGKPEIPDHEIREAKSEFEAKKTMVLQHQRDLKVIRSNLTYLRCGKWCRDVLDSQPWYLWSTLAAGAGFVIFLFTSLLCIVDLRWNLGLAIFGFLVGFVLLAFCQLFPGEDKSQRSLDESLFLESVALAGLASAAPLMDSAKAKYEWLSERFDLKSHLQKTTADLAAATQELGEARKEYHRAKSEYEVAKESCSRKNRLLSSDWKALRGIEFEEFLAEVFKDLGFQVQTTKVTGDHGVDLIIFKDETKIAIQAKGYPKTTVGNSAVQEAYSGVAIHGCSTCAVVTNSFFTAHARDAARHLRCLLVDQVQMGELIRGKIRGLT